MKIAKKSNAPPNPDPVSVSSRGAANEGKMLSKNRSVTDNFFMLYIFFCQTAPSVWHI